MVRKWEYDDKSVLETPSHAKGMLVRDEKKLRREGVKCILVIGKALRLYVCSWRKHVDRKAKPTLATAGVYFQRFYMVYPFQEYPWHKMALGCLFLAGKVEETPKKCRDVVAAAKDSVPILFGTLESNALAEDVMQMERVLLQTMHFELFVDHPYDFLYEYMMQLTFIFDKEKQKEILQVAYGLINDSISTTLSLRYQPEVLAVGALEMGMRMKIGPDPNRNNWWSKNIANLSPDMVEKIGHEFMDYYTVIKEDKFDWLPVTEQAIAPQFA